MSFAAFFAGLCENAVFSSWFSRLLASVPYSGFKWETPPVTSFNFDRPFEFVVLNSPGLAGRLDPKAFREHFKAGRVAVSFPNLGMDAILVAPVPHGSEEVYGHLASFVRNAHEIEQQEFWKLIGVTMQQRIGDNPVWLSTAGAGVAWLHVRLDDRPKYYGHAPYRTPPN
jgi:hypothetical protein